MNLVATRKTLGFSKRGACFIYLGGKGPPHAADWDEYIAWFAKNVPAPGTIISALIYEQGSGPNAAQRKRLTDITSQYPLRAAVVTTSAIARGVLTAMSWFAKGKGFQAFNPEELDAALAHLEIDQVTAATVKQAVRELIRQLDTA